MDFNSEQPMKLLQAILKVILLLHTYIVIINVSTNTVQDLRRPEIYSFYQYNYSEVCIFQNYNKHKTLWGITFKLLVTIPLLTIVFIRGTVMLTCDKSCDN